MSTVSIKIRVINQLTGVVETEGTVSPSEYSFEVMEANANAMADMMPDCQVSMFASNDDFVCIPSRNMMKDEASMEFDSYMAKWYSTAEKSC